MRWRYEEAQGDIPMEAHQNPSGQCKGIPHPKAGKPVLPEMDVAAFSYRNFNQMNFSTEGE
jgi:hypothetical protein